MGNRKKKMGLSGRRNLVGFIFLLPAVLLICFMSFYPMIRALILSFRTGVGVHMKFAGFYNYTRMNQDKVFIQALINNFIYLIIQVPVMLLLALGLAAMLNDSKLKFKGLFRTAIFLPCATSLVSYAIIFRALFSLDGFINTLLLKTNIIDMPVNWLGSPATARAVIIIALIWRWTGYNMVFYLAGLQNIEYNIYEAAKIDGANPLQQFSRITIPLLRPIILLTAIMSTNGTLQLFDESVNLTNGGPANATITMSHYIYKMSFEYSPNFGYATAMSFLVLVLVAILAFIQMKAGDKR
jgi:lactose/L-arabinose transport system permease protein